MLSRFWYLFQRKWSMQFRRIRWTRRGRGRCCHWGWREGDVNHVDALFRWWWKPYLKDRFRQNWKSRHFHAAHRTSHIEKVFGWMVNRPNCEPGGVHHQPTGSGVAESLIVKKGSIPTLRFHLTELTVGGRRFWLYSSSRAQLWLVFLETIQLEKRSTLSYKKKNSNHCSKIYRQRLRAHSLPHTSWCGWLPQCTLQKMAFKGLRIWMNLPRLSSCLINYERMETCLHSWPRRKTAHHWYCRSPWANCRARG